MKYSTVYADPPWPIGLTGKRKRKKGGASQFLPYPTMTIDQIAALPIDNITSPGAHLWLWTTNATIQTGFDIMQAWGFTYLAPIHWIKPTGIGNWFVHLSQTVLFGYKQSCQFLQARYRPNIITAPARKHSQKPLEFYDLIESISPPPRLELFARPYSEGQMIRPGWDAYGNEIEPSITL
jgi:N6-adenosine-specific RNA methylase IME4